MARKHKKLIDEELLELEDEFDEWDSVTPELDVAPTEQASYNNVRIVNKIGARVKIPGSVTGKLYVWERAGAVVDVDERDAPDLLTKTIGGNRCCGSANKNYVFEIMKE